MFFLIFSKNEAGHVLVLVVGSRHPAELLQNGSFETGDFSGWTLTGSQNSIFVQPTTFCVLRLALLVRRLPTGPASG
jgi:hypothetical protein